MEGMAWELQGAFASQGKEGKAVVSDSVMLIRAVF